MIKSEKQKIILFIANIKVLLLRFCLLFKIFLHANLRDSKSLENNDKKL